MDILHYGKLYERLLGFVHFLLYALQIMPVKRNYIYQQEIINLKFSF